MEKVIKIVFFSSGDFGIPIFERLINEKYYEVVGLVTSNDKVRYHQKRLYTMALENGIPVCIPSDLESENFIESLRNLNADVFCVISYKKLPQKVIDVVQGKAFNVHASYLPFLRGAAPINWAIRLGFKQTGVTSILLSDKIDCGNIIKSYIVDIAEDDDYDSLFKKLSMQCVYATFATLYYFKKGWIDVNGGNPQINIGVENELLKAPKVDANYFKIDKYTPIQRLLHSVPKGDGIPCTIKVKSNEDSKIDKTFLARIYDVKEVSKSKETDKSWESDGKTYLHINNPMLSKELISIERIKVNGRKEMEISQFLNGFRYFSDKDKYKVDFIIGREEN